MIFFWPQTDFKQIFNYVGTGKFGRMDSSVYRAGVRGTWRSVLVSSRSQKGSLKKLIEKLYPSYLVKNRQTK